MLVKFSTSSTYFSGHKNAFSKCPADAKPQLSPFRRPHGFPPSPSIPRAQYPSPASKHSWGGPAGSESTPVGRGRRCQPPHAGSRCRTPHFGDFHRGCRSCGDDAGPQVPPQWIGERLKNISLALYCWDVLCELQVPYHPNSTPVSMAMAAVQSSQQIQASGQHTDYPPSLQNCMTLF